MILVSGNNNRLIYYSRYNRIDKFEIFDHSLRLVYSGITSIVGDSGKILHSGITYDFGTTESNYYTYKGYYLNSTGDTTYYLANHTMLTSIVDRNSTFKPITKSKNTFKTK